MTEYRFYREDGTSEVVQPEEWQWVARYLDGTILKQFDDSGIFHQFREIKQDQLDSFAMICPAPVELPPVIIGWAPGRKLIHFYQRHRRDVGSPSERRFTVYCFGYETPTEKVILMLMPDGGIVVTDDTNKVVVN